MGGLEQKQRGSLPPPASAIAVGPEAPAELVDRVRALAESAGGYAIRARGPRTRKEYGRARRTYERWCEAHGLFPLAPEVVALYLAARADAGKSPATIEQDLAALRALFLDSGLAPPRETGIVLRVRAGIRRTRGVAQKQKAPLLARDLRSVLGKLPETPRGTRDRALLLVGWLGAFRRSELVGLKVSDLEWVDEGVKVHLRRSKTDPEGQGRVVGLPRGKRPETCPVAALIAWLDGAGIAGGPVFRRVSRKGEVGESALDPGSVARVVKAAARAAGLDPAGFAGHSLRSGLATSAAAAGKAERTIMRQLGHRGEAMTRRYIREAGVFAENAAEGLL